MKKTLVYIDGYNLYYGLLKESPASKWLNLRALVAAMFKEKHEISSIKFFTARTGARSTARRHGLRHLPRPNTISNLRIAPPALRTCGAKALRRRIIAPPLRSRLEPPAISAALTFRLHGHKNHNKSTSVPSLQYPFMTFSARRMKASCSTRDRSFHLTFQPQMRT